MTITYTTTRCHLCGQSSEPLKHDGKSFIVCQDAAGCLCRVERLERAEYNALKTRAKELGSELSRVLRRQGELEVSLGLYAAVVDGHKAEVARIEEETK